MMMEQVTQADEAAAKAMLEHAFRNVGVRALKDVRFADIVEHFAKHRQAERAECIRIVDDFETFSGDPRDDAVRDVMAVNLQEALGAFSDKVAPFVESYEFRYDDGGSYTPRQEDRAMLEDAIHGFLGEVIPMPDPTGAIGVGATNRPNPNTGIAPPRSRDFDQYPDGRYVDPKNDDPVQLAERRANSKGL